MISHIVHRPCLNVLHRLDVEDVVHSGYILILSESASRTNHRLLLGRKPLAPRKMSLSSDLVLKTYQPTNITEPGRSMPGSFRPHWHVQYVPWLSLCMLTLTRSVFIPLAPVRSML